MLDAGRTGQVMDLFFESIRLVTSRTPRARVVLLRGSTGAGRTGLLQGLYELATGQQEPPAYWPTKLVDDHLAAELTREILTPDDFEVSAGARMPFLWLALSGRDELALSRADVQLRAHASGFARAVENISARDQVRLLALGQSVLLIAGFVPVLGHIVQALQTMATVQEAARDLASTWPEPESVVREALTVSTTRRFSRREDAEEQAEHDARLLAEMARHLPVLLAIDDADGLDEVTIAFLDALVRSPQARALVVMTVNTDHHPTHPDAPVDEERADHNAELHGLLARLPDRLLKVVDLVPFSPDELLKLMLAHEATAQTVDRPLPEQVVADLVETANGAPGRMMSLLEHGVTRAALAGDAELPDDLEALTARSNVNELWRSLAPGSRSALATLAVHGPHTLTCLVREPHIGADAVASSWVRVVPLGTEEIEQLEFRSLTFYATARARLGSELSPEQVARVRQQLVEDLMARRQTWPDLPSAVLESLFDTIIDSGADIPADLLATLLRLRRVTGREATVAALSKAEAGRSGDLSCSPLPRHSQTPATPRALSTSSPMSSNDSPTGMGKVTFAPSPPVTTLLAPGPSVPTCRHLRNVVRDTSGRSSSTKRSLPGGRGIGPEEPSTGGCPWLIATWREPVPKRSDTATRSSTASNASSK